VFPFWSVGADRRGGVERLSSWMLTVSLGLKRRQADQGSIVDIEWVVQKRSSSDSKNSAIFCARRVLIREV
jgi:hypothetical protein